ncbi:hypothetical protein ACMG5L_23445 [Escherichia coli]|uniref:hypothetical protein n=1 Tax=Escherichia coli TaxID=562 RepID=UPI0039BF092F
MSWIKVVLFIILVAVAIGLFLYTRRKEQKRKPSRPLVTGVVTLPAKQDGLPKSLYMAEVTLDSPKGNELVLEMLMQKHYKDAVLTAEYWEDPNRPGKRWRAWYPLHVPCTNTWIEWPALVSYRSTDQENKAAFFLDTNRFKWYPDKVTNEPVWMPKKGGTCFTVGQVLLTDLDNQNNFFVIEEEKLNDLIPY